MDDLLDVSRISRGKIELRKARVDLVEVARQAVETLRPLSETREQELSMTAPPACQKVSMTATPLI